MSAYPVPFYQLIHGADLSPVLLAQCWGPILAEGMARRSCTDLSPQSVEAYIERWQQGLFRPVVVLSGNAIVACHWLHDMNRKQQSAWCGAWLSPLIRGRLLDGSKCDYWGMVLRLWDTWGFRHYFANVIGFNQGAIDANRLFWHFSYVGRYRNHRPVQGVLTDAMLFSRYDTPKDRELCFAQAHAMAFPAPGELEPAP